MSTTNKMARTKSTPRRWTSLIAYIAHEISSLPIESEALLELEKAANGYLAEIQNDAKLAAKLDKRDCIEPRDMLLARRLRG